MTAKFPFCKIIVPVAFSIVEYSSVKNETGPVKLVQWRKMVVSTDFDCELALTG